MKKISEKISDASQSISLKLIAIGFLILLLLIPIAWIKNLIREREKSRNEVITDISEKWGQEQTISAPILTVPYLVYVNDNNKVHEIKKFAHFLPESLSCEGEVNPEIRYRGIYKVVTYQSGLSFSGSFKRPDFTKFSIPEENVLWKEAMVSIGIPDMRGITNNIDLIWNKKTFITEPGLPTKEIIQSGLSSKIDLDKNKESYSYQFTINLNGSKKLQFIPLGKETNIHIKSNWANPKFTGSYLPASRTINNDGFTANWKVLHVNRNYPQEWLSGAYSVNGSEFGFELLFPVDQYQKTMRSAKYSVMFIALTFLVFFFIEIINKKRIHPIQYLLVSIGIILFYSLLLSLSEQLSFTLSYLLAASAIIVLITTYIQLSFHKLKISFSLFFFLVVLYSFLFTLLQLQDYALLLGNIGLFIALAIAMFASRKINWYAKLDKSEN